MKSKLKFKFSNIDHGWMSIEIKYANNSVTYDVSHVPYDSLTELMDAVIFMINSNGVQIVQWSLEPGYWVWEFMRSDDEIAFKFSRNDDIQSVYCNSDDLILQLYRALRLLETKFADIEHNTWSWGFPHEKLDRIETLIKNK